MGTGVRLFRIEVTACPAGGGAMRLVAALTAPSSVRTYLAGVGLPARAPPIAAARPAPQPEFAAAA